MDHPAAPAGRKLQDVDSWPAAARPYMAARMALAAALASLQLGAAAGAWSQVRLYLF